MALSNNQYASQAIIVPRATLLKNQLPTRLALFDVDGNAIDLSGSEADTGATVKLTGYASGPTGNVAATDTVNQAVAKLEARLAALESAS